MILLSIYLLSIIDAGKPKIRCPERSNFEEWPKSQIFIFHTQNPREYDYPDCFGTLLNSFTCADYSRVLISSDEVFFKILKKPFIVQK